MTGVKRKFAIFEAFGAYLRESLIFFDKIFMVARTHQVLAVDIKNFLVSALVSLETWLKVPIMAIFFIYFGIFKLSVLAQAFDLGKRFFSTKI